MSLHGNRKIEVCFSRTCKHGSRTVQRQVTGQTEQVDGGITGGGGHRATTTTMTEASQTSCSPWNVPTDSSATIIRRSRQSASFHSGTECLSLADTSSPVLTFTSIEQQTTSKSRERTVTGRTTRPTRGRVYRRQRVDVELQHLQQLCELKGTERKSPVNDTATGRVHPRQLERHLSQTEVSRYSSSIQLKRSKHLVV